MIIGSKISDNGNLLLDQEEKDKIISENPNASKFMHIGASEFIKGDNDIAYNISENIVEEAYKKWGAIS
jgi:hypothetical protein